MRKPSGTQKTFHSHMDYSFKGEWVTKIAIYYEKWWVDWLSTGKSECNQSGFNK